MKNLVIFFVTLVHIIYVINAEGSYYNTEIEKNAEECLTITGTSKDDIPVLFGQKIAENKAQACLGACVFKKMEVMNDQNEIDKEKAINLTEPLKEENPDAYKKLTDAIKKCHPRQQPNADECAAFKSFLDCVKMEME